MQSDHKVSNPSARATIVLRLGLTALATAAVALAMERPWKR